MKIRFPTLDIQHIIKDILKLNINYMLHEDYGHYSYTEHYSLGDIFIYTSADEEKGVLLELKGRGCRQFESYLLAQERSWYDFLMDALVDGGVMKRIDLAINDHTGILDIPELAEKCRKREYIGKSRSYKFYQSGELIKHREDDREYMGRTLYLGSLKSDVYFCIYEKDYEQYVKLGTPLEEADIINRFEIRLRNERAYYAVRDLPPNSLDTESSIKQGCKYFASLLSSCKNQGIDDLNVAIQSYNYGGGYVGYVAGKGKKHTFNLAESFAREKSGGKKVTYTNPIAVAKNGGWRYGYGNMFYVEVVNQYLAVPQVSGELAQKVMNEALKYQGWKYVYGGSNPNTSFDCSGLTQWCYGKAGISLPRTAQAQYDATQHLPLSQAKAGDLVFFHSTYNAGSYVTHVGILVSPTQMYHAGDPIGYADLSSSYWQQHLIGAGRVKQ